MIFYYGIGKGDHDFILVLKSNHTYITYRLHYNQVLPLTGNDVIVLSPLGGTASNFPLRNWKGRPQPYIHVALTFCVYLEPFTSYSTSYNWLG